MPEKSLFERLSTPQEFHGNNLKVSGSGRTGFDVREDVENILLGKFQVITEITDGVLKYRDTLFFFEPVGITSEHLEELAAIASTFDEMFRND